MASRGQMQADCSDKLVKSDVIQYLQLLEYLIVQIQELAESARNAEHKIFDELRERETRETVNNSEVSAVNRGPSKAAKRRWRKTRLKTSLQQ